MTNYTILNRNSGEIEQQDASAIDVMEAILTHDGHRYEIRPMDGGFELYVSRGSAASSGGYGGLVLCWTGGAESRPIRSRKASLAEARQEIAEAVVSSYWVDATGPEIMTDESYAQLLAELGNDA